MSEKNKYMWQLLRKSTKDFYVLHMAHGLLQKNGGLEKFLFLQLSSYVFNELGPTTEAKDLFKHVQEKDGKFILQDPA